VVGLVVGRAGHDPHLLLVVLFFVAVLFSFSLLPLEWLVVVSGSSWLAWLVEVGFLEVEELPLVVELLALL